MKQMAWAKYMAAIENRSPITSGFGLDLIKPYVPQAAGGGINICPEYGYYSAPNTILGNITCNLTNRGHRFPDSP